MKFKILHTEWSNGWGGQELRILLDAVVLRKMGHDVTIMGVPDGQMVVKAREKGVPVIEQTMRHAYDLPVLWKLVGLLKKERYDVVNTHSSVDSWLVSAAAKLAGTPVLVRTRHLSVPLATHPFNFVYKWPDAIVTTAEMIRQSMIERNGYDPDRVVSIPTGVDLGRFNPWLDPGGIREELGLPEQGRVATMVAVLRSWKRHEIFLEAAAMMSLQRPDLRFLVVGEGPRRKQVEAKISELGLGDRVIMTGHRNDVERILAVSDVCFLTSESSEGVPQSVLQYQAMARPVVGTTAGGIPEVIEDGRTGLLCPINDPAALAEAGGRLLDDRELAADLGRSARRRVEERHSQEAMAEATLAMYERIFRAKKDNLK